MVVVSLIINAAGQAVWAPLRRCPILKYWTIRCRGHTQYRDKLHFLFTKCKFKPYTIGAICTIVTTNFTMKELKS